MAGQSARIDIEPASGWSTDDDSHRLATIERVMIVSETWVRGEDDAKKQRGDYRKFLSHLPPHFFSAVCSPFRNEDRSRRSKTSASLRFPARSEWPFPVVPESCSAAPTGRRPALHVQCRRPHAARSVRSLLLENDRYFEAPAACVRKGEGIETRCRYEAPRLPRSRIVLL